MVDELGYQTYETGNPLYTGVESSPVVSEAIQATDYALIVHLYSCDPAISTVLFFHLIDETNFNITSTSGGWQSGLEHPTAAPNLLRRSPASHRPGLHRPAGHLETCQRAAHRYGRRDQVQQQRGTPRNSRRAQDRHPNVEHRQPRSRPQTVKLPVTWFLPAGDFILPVAEIPTPTPPVRRPSASR